MKKRYLYIFWVIFLIIIFWVLEYFFGIKSIKDEFSNEVYIKNNSWNTEYLNSVPYKKNDELEVFFVIKNEKKQSGKINYDWLKKKIDIDKIFIDDKEISKDDNIDVDWWVWVKIIWKAKENWILKNDDIDLNFEVTKDNQKEIEETKKDLDTYSWSIKIFFSKYSLNSNKNNLIELTWSWINQIKYVNIWWHSLTPISENNKVFLSIDKNTFDNWSYFIILQLLNWELLTLNEKLYFEFDNEKINITNITPNILKKDTDRNIVLQWNWFSKIISIQLNNNIILSNATFEIISDKVVIIKLPKDINAWTYYLNIMWTDKIYEIKNKNFVINN